MRYAQSGSVELRLLHLPHPLLSTSLDVSTYIIAGKSFIVKCLLRIMAVITLVDGFRVSRAYWLLRPWPPARTRELYCGQERLHITGQLGCHRLLEVDDNRAFHLEYVPREELLCKRSFI